MTAPSINPAISVSDNPSTPITSQPKTFTIANLSEAPIGMRTVAQIEQKQSGDGQSAKNQSNKLMRMPIELLQLCVEEAVRLAPGKMPERLAQLREVCKLFCDIADKVERSTEDIAHASTATKIRNVMLTEQLPHLRQPTLESVFGSWNHIAVSLSRITDPNDRVMLLRTLATQSDKRSLSLDLHDVHSSELDYLRRIAENNPNASAELSLSGRTLLLSEINDMLRPFAEHQSMVKLSLCDMKLDEKMFQSLLPAISEFSNLTALRLDTIMRPLYPFGALDMRSLGEILSGFKSLADLDLSTNLMDSAAMRELAMAARKFSPIRHLSMRENFLNVTSMTHLCSVLRSHQSSIESLNLENTGMTCGSVKLLAGVLPELIHLKHLNLEYNLFREHGMQALTPVLAAHPFLEELSMTGCNAIGFDQIKLLAEALAKSNSSLRHVAFDWEEAGIMAELSTPIIVSTLKGIASLRAVTLPARDGTMKKIELERN